MPQELPSFFQACCAAAMLTVFAAPALAEEQWLTFRGDSGPGKGKKIVLVSGDEEYRSEEALPQLAKILSKHHGFDCVVTFSVDPNTGMINPNLHTNMPGVQALESADLMILLTRFRDPPPDQMKYFVDYINAGKPIIGLRTATHAFEIKKGPDRKYSYDSKAPGWEGGFGRKILGETWISHHGDHKKQSTRGLIAPGMESSPLLRGCDDIWVPTDVYGVRLPLPGDSKPLILGEVLSGMKPTDPPVKGPKNNPMLPVAWTKTYEGESGHVGRVFTTTMVSAVDLENESLRRLIVNAAYWCLGMEDQIPPKADVGIVGEYRPTDFGFNGYRKNHRPSDYAGDQWPK
jgi:hypothetical protein